MGYLQRKELYRQHEEKRGKPLIVYVTSIRQNIRVQMLDDSISTIIEQINCIPSEQREVDFLIVSNGGDPITALRIITILRERFDKVSVIVPYVAFSAATILALGANEIIMHPYSNLGPVDPQISITKSNELGQPSQLQFGSEDIRNYIEFIRSDVGITDQAQLITAFNSLATEIGSLSIGSSKRSQQLSLSLSKKMLETHLSDKSKASSIAQSLNTSYYHHGYTVGRKEAQEMGLNIVFPPKELEDIMWAIWLDFCDEMKCSQPFELTSEIMNNPTAYQVLSQVPIVQIPANIPPQIIDKYIDLVAQQNIQIIKQNPIELSLPIMAIESLQCAYVYNNRINIVYWRNSNMALAFNAISSTKGWEKI